MQATRRHSIFRFWLLISFILVCACSGGEDDFSNEHLIRVGERVVTVLDFNKAFELAETAHSFGLHDDPAQLQEARERLLNQMTIEMLMLTRADELSIDVPDEELNAKIDEIKADYPDGTFEEALLEAAVPFEDWKQRMKTRLLVEKLIAIELENQMTITPKDITAHYEKYFKSKTDPDKVGTGEDSQKAVHGAIIKDLRRHKAEEAYDAWVEGLKAMYPVELNASVWKKLTTPIDDAEAGNQQPSKEQPQ